MIKLIENSYLIDSNNQGKDFSVQYYQPTKTYVLEFLLIDNSDICKYKIFNGFWG